MTAIKEDSGTTATGQIGVRVLAALDGEPFDRDAFDVVTTDDGERGGRASVVRDHVVSGHWFTHTKDIFVLP